MGHGRRRGERAARVFAPQGPIMDRAVAHAFAFASAISNGDRERRPGIAGKVGRANPLSLAAADA